MLNALRPLLLLAAFIAMVPVAAQDPAPPPPPSQPPPTQIRSQREDAGAQVRQVERAGGRVLQAEPMQRGGREVYRFKVLTPEGRVRVMQGEPQGGTPDPVRSERRERPRSPGFDRSSELTARRRDVRDDGGADMARERDPGVQMRRDPPMSPPPRAAGEPAGD